MNIRKLMCVTFIGFLLIAIVMITSPSALHISQGSATHISSDSGDERHPVVCQMPNGNLLCVWSDGSGDVGAQFIEGKISTDNGSSWGSEIQIYPVGGGGDDGTMDKDPEVFVTPNGTIALFFQDQATAGYDRNYLHYMLSYDNASTWVDKGRIGENFEGTWDARRFTGGDTYGNTMYFCGESYMYAPGYQGTHFWKSEDNCQSFTLINATINTSTELVNEWDICCLSSTHFIGIARDLDSGASKDTFWLETTNAGVTWDITTITSEMDTLWGGDDGAMDDPDMDWLNREKGVIIIHGRTIAEGSSDRCGYFITNDSGENWYNYTQLYDSDKQDEYTGFAEYVEGDRGYLVYSGNDDIYGRMIYDLTNYPPDPEVPDTNISIQSINLESNNSIIYESAYLFNWTNMSLSGNDYYQLQIANDSGFADVFLDVDINETLFTSSYSEKGNYVEFTLPSAYRKLWDGYQYYRVRPMDYLGG